MTAGEQVRDFIEVQRAASFFVSAATDARERASFDVAHVATGVPQSLRSFAEHWWEQWRAKGSLVFGSVPYRDSEVMRYVG
jgi:nucleoside-diphosphate-sugar epimerase